MYQREWELLKSKGHGGSIKISAPSLVHKRVYKALRKEKDIDLAYKYELSEQGKAAVLSASSTGLILTVTIRIKDAVKYFNSSNLF